MFTVPENKSNSFLWLNVTQFLGALNDNIFKLLTIFALIAVEGKEQASLIVALAGMTFVAPFLIFSALAGSLADRVSKRTIIVTVKILENVIMIFGVVAFISKIPVLLYGSLFLMSTHSAFFGPVKYGIVPELVGRDNLTRANSFLVLWTFLAIIFGTFLAPFLAGITHSQYDHAGYFCILIAMLGVAASIRIRKTAPAGSAQQASLFFIRDIWHTLRSIRRDRYLTVAIMASMYFYMVGAFMQLNLIPYGMEVLNLTQEQSGYLFLIAALGIAAGAVLAGRISGKTIEFGLVPAGALGLSVGSCLFTLTNSNISVWSVVAVIGVSAGLYIVPLETFIQYKSPRENLGKILAAANFLSWIGILVASGLIYLFSEVFHLSSRHGFLVLGILTLCFTCLILYYYPVFTVRMTAMIGRLFSARPKKNERKKEEEKIDV